MPTSIEEILARMRPNIRRLKPYSSARSGARPKDLQNSILLNANENPYAPPLKAHNYYPEPQPQALLQGLSQIYQVDTQQIVVGRGSDEGIDLLIRAFCAETDAIAICCPTFGMYRCYAEIQGCQIIDIALQIESLSNKLCRGLLPMDQLRNLLKENSSALKLLFIPSPLAPLGSLIPAPQLLELLKLCAQNNIVLVIDEAYAEFAQVLRGYQSMLAHLATFPNLVVLRTLSKAYALAGERVGSLIAHPKLASALRAAQSPYPLSSSSSSYATAILSDKKALQDSANSIQKLAEQQRRLFSFLESLPCVRKIFQSAANFIMVQFEDSRSVLELCQAEGLILRNFSQELEGAIRISVGTAEQMDKLMELLLKYQKTVSQNKQEIFYKE